MRQLHGLVVNLDDERVRRDVSYRKLQVHPIAIYSSRGTSTLAFPLPVLVEQKVFQSNHVLVQSLFSSVLYQGI